MYAREGELAKLNRDRNDILLPMSARKDADKAFQKILSQMRDKKLMAMRERLVKAARAGDEEQIHRITLQMRSYSKEPLESGIYGK